MDLCRACFNSPGVGERAERAVRTSGDSGSLTSSLAVGTSGDSDSPTSSLAVGTSGDSDSSTPSLVSPKDLGSSSLLSNPTQPKSCPDLANYPCLPPAHARSKSENEIRISREQKKINCIIMMAVTPDKMAVTPDKMDTEINSCLDSLPNRDEKMEFFNNLFKSFLDNLDSCLIRLDEDSSNQNTDLYPLLEGLDTIRDFYETKLKKSELLFKLPDIIKLLSVPNLPQVFKTYIIENNQSFFGKNNATHTYNLHYMTQLMRKPNATFFNNVLIIFTDILRSPSFLKLRPISKKEKIKDFTSVSPVIKDLLSSLEHLYKHSEKPIPFNLDFFKTHLDRSFLETHRDNPNFIFVVYESIFNLFRHTWFSKSENMTKHRPSIQQGAPPLITSLETPDTRHEDRIIPFFKRIERLYQYNPSKKPPSFIFVKIDKVTNKNNVQKTVYQKFQELMLQTVDTVETAKTVETANQQFQSLMFHRYICFILNELTPSRMDLLQPSVSDDDSDSRYDPTNSRGTPPEYKFEKLSDRYEEKFLPRTQSASAIPTSTDL